MTDRKPIYRVTDALAGEYLQATIGTAYRVHENCGSPDQRIATMDYDLPERIRVRFAACRVHRQAEQVQRADATLRSPFTRRALASQLPGKVLA